MWRRGKGQDQTGRGESGSAPVQRQATRDAGWSGMWVSQHGWGRPHCRHEARSYTGSAVNIRTVGVVGCGLMGSGIAEVVARAEYSTIVREVNEELVGKGRQRIEKSLSTAVERGKLDAAERDAAL